MQPVFQQYMCIKVFLQLVYERVFLDVVVTCLLMTDMIIVFSVWASNTLKLQLWMTHAPVVEAWLHCDLTSFL